MQCLYQFDIKGKGFDEIVSDTIRYANFIDETKDFAIYLATDAYEKLEEIDSLIKEKAIDWSFDRIAKIDKSILRVAIAELMTEKIPVSVVINEAVEMAKKYSTDESVRFINGILGNIKIEK